MRRLPTLITVPDVATLGLVVTLRDKAEGCPLNSAEGKETSPGWTEMAKGRLALLAEAALDKYGGKVMEEEEAPEIAEMALEGDVEVYWSKRSRVFDDENVPPTRRVREKSFGGWSTSE